MAGYQSIQVIGNVGRDPEKRFTQSGDPVTGFSLAVGHKKKDGSDDTEWFDISCWNKLADVANDYLVKGSQVFISGRVALEVYTKKDGSPGAKMKITARELQLLGKKGDNAESDGPKASSEENLPF